MLYKKLYQYTMPEIASFQRQNLFHTSEHFEVVKSQTSINIPVHLAPSSS